MKKIGLVVLVVALAVGSLGAQGRMGGVGMGGPGMGPLGDFEWKEGTSVTHEYKTLTGTLVIGQKLETTLKVGTVEYILDLPRNASSVLNVKNGDSITIEGIVSTVRGTTPAISPRIGAIKATVAGTVIDLLPADAISNMGQGQGRGPMNGQDMQQGPRGRR